jgi:hypothetical protein
MPIPNLTESITWNGITLDTHQSLHFSLIKKIDCLFSFFYLIDSIDTQRLAVAVRNLLRGNPDLIQGFDTFLPEKFRLDERNFDQVTDLINKIKVKISTSYKWYWYFFLVKVLMGVSFLGCRMGCNTRLTLIRPFVEVLDMYCKVDDTTHQDFYRDVRMRAYIVKLC